MAFKVIYSNGVQHKYTDEDKYEVSDGGVLNLSYVSGNGKTHIYPPQAWVYLVADQSHKPGSTGGDYDVQESVR
jgi:hypothetical protein